MQELLEKIFYFIKLRRIYDHYVMSEKDDFIYESVHLHIPIEQDNDYFDFYYPYLYPKYDIIIISRREYRKTNQVIYDITYNYAYKPTCIEELYDIIRKILNYIVKYKSLTNQDREYLTLFILLENLRV